MAALTLEQLRERSRAKFPITVVREEIYTTMTPAEVASAWSAAVFWDGTTYLKNVAGTWEAFTDEATVNDRGFYVGGGLVNYAELQDFSDCTAEQALPGTWDVDSDITCVCSAKGTEDGLPYVTLSFTGDPNEPSVFTRGPVSQLSAGVITEGSVLVARNMATIVQVPTEVTEIKGYVYQADPFVGDQPDNGIVPGSYIYDANIVYGNDETTIDSVFPLISCSDATFDAALLIKVFPRIFYSSAAVPDSVTYINTTTDPQIVTPQVVQRPIVQDGPWSVVLEGVVPERYSGSYSVLYSLVTASDKMLIISWTGNRLEITHVDGAVWSGQPVENAVVAPGSHFKIAFAADAQRFRASVNGEAVTVLNKPRFSTSEAETLGAYLTGLYSAFATFKSITVNRGLVSDAQLIEWSTLS